MTNVSTMPNPLPEMNPYGGVLVAPEGLDERARDVAKDALRQLGQLTAGMRPGPDFLVVGTKRGGTTSMFNYLLDHPQVLRLFPAAEKRKGTYYFDVNATVGRDDTWYRSHFPTVLSRTVRGRLTGRFSVVGEATPYYLYHPLAPERAQHVVPEAKIIMLLRDPVERAYSHWKERTRQGVEHLEFVAALDAEPERLQGEVERMLAEPGYHSFAHQHFSYIDQGRYAAGVRRWLEAFGDDRVLILQSETFYADPATALDTVHDFLGLDRHQSGEFKKWNFHRAPDMTDDIAARIQNAVADDVADLEKLLDRSFGWF
jgi:hypothetical protein